MTERSDQRPAADDAELPAGLAAALWGVFDPAPAVPPGVDEGILREARAGFSRRRRFSLAVRWAGSAAAAAAAVVVVAVVLHRGRPGTHVAVNTGSVVAGDVDANGRVDMLDAFLLARKLDANAPAGGKADDVNGDGVVDRRDVDAVAAMAVRLPGGAR
jgi:hypothetical protein